jgi:hypothetical protein
MGKQAAGHGPGGRKRPPDKVRRERLVEMAVVDAYGEDEQRSGFLVMIEDHPVLPFETRVLGLTVTVERVDLDEADEIVAICWRRGERQAIPVLQLPLPEPPPAGAKWIEAYRHWARGF